MLLVAMWFKGVQNFAGRLYPEEVSGHVLAYLLASAEMTLGHSIDKAVISVQCFNAHGKILR